MLWRHLVTLFAVCQTYSPVYTLPGSCFTRVSSCDTRDSPPALRHVPSPWRHMATVMHAVTKQYMCNNPHECFGTTRARH
jgi:hypothetical protein